MGKKTSEIAKSVLSELNIKDTRIERFMASTSVGFGLDLRATRAGFEAFVEAAVELGLEPTLNRFRRLDESGEPVEYVYDIFVEIPTGWSKP